MKKHYILFQVFPPQETDEPEKARRWRESRDDALNKNKPTEGTLRLGDNSWLLPRDSKLHLLAALISVLCLQGHNYSIHYLCSEDDETTP